MAKPWVNLEAGDAPENGDVLPEDEPAEPLVAERAGAVGRAARGEHDTQEREEDGFWRGGARRATGCR